MSLEALALDLAGPGAVAPAAAIGAAVRRSDTGDWSRQVVAAGRLGAGPGEPAASVDTPFDLASVTKPVTALVFARLVRAGRLAWDTPLGALVEEARGTPSERVALEMLLAHRAGLGAHEPLFAPLLTGDAVDPRAALTQAARARRVGCEGAPPFAPVYSDLGYLLLGEALARCEGLALDLLVAREVAAPLGLDLGSARQWEARAPAFVARAAATEEVAFRGGVVRGRVHDENAWALVGDACAGHAGLFGTVGSVLDLGVAVADALADRRPGWLGAADVEPLVRVRPGGTLRAGFDGKSEGASSAGARFGPRSIGHLGFTGTSLWLDPERDRVGVLLTNRVHPTRASAAIREARPRVYDAIAAWADASPRSSPNPTIW